MATKGMRRVALAAGAVAAALVLVAAVGTRPQAERAQAASVEPASVRRTPASVAARGRYPSEERFVRDLYARLMRYDFAAREFHAIEGGAALAPGSYLTSRCATSARRHGPARRALAAARPRSRCPRDSASGAVQQRRSVPRLLRCLLEPGRHGARTTPAGEHRRCEPLHPLHRDAHARRREPHVSGDGAVPR